jgi:hypothetical protein
LNVGDDDDDDDNKRKGTNVASLQKLLRVRKHRKFMWTGWLNTEVGDSAGFCTCRAKGGVKAKDNFDASMGVKLFY